MKAGQLIGALSLTSLLLLGCERQSDTLSNSYNPTIDGVATDVTAQPPDLSILQPQVASVPSGTIRPPVPTPPVASACRYRTGLRRGSHSPHDPPADRCADFAAAGMSQPA